MKIALLSLDASVGGICESNLRELLGLAVKKSAVVALLPELSYGGYCLDKSHFANFEYECAVCFYSSLANEHGIAIGFGAAAKLADNTYVNRYAIVSSKGDMLACYDKTHLFSFGGECEVFTAGDRLQTFELSGLKFGISICYDLRFPEIFSVYSQLCDAVICPSAWPAKRMSHFNTLLRARSIENAFSVIGINWQGDSLDGVKYKKSSSVAMSGKIKKPIFSGSELDIYEIKSKNSAKCGINIVADKRFDLYAGLMSGKTYE